MKFSLKFKILSSIFVLLSLVTLANLIYSYRLFVEDKESYIYEAVLKKSENISDQINLKIDELNSRSILNNKLISLSSGENEKLISSQSDLLLINSIEKSSKPIFINDKLSNNFVNKFGLDSSKMMTLFAQALSSNQNRTSNYLILNPNPSLYLIGFISSKSNSTQISIFDISKLFEMFSHDLTYSIDFFDQSKPDTNNSIYKIISASKNNKGATKVNFQNINYLVGYSKIGDNLIIATKIDTSKAFNITNFLILKTTIFALLLLSISLIGGIYFSASITHPLNILTDAAKKLAAGNFDEKVEINTTDEIKTLSNSFNFMSDEIQSLLVNKQHLIEKLEDYSKNLENMVEQRTKELKDANDFMALMVNSLDQGLLVFDQDLNCHPMFTKACEPIFGVSPLNKTLNEVLDINDEEGIQSLKQWSMVIFTEMLPFDSAVDLGPRNKITGKNYNDKNFKHVQIDYYPMRNDDEKITNLVLIATDKTKELQATYKSKENEAYVTMILKIINNKTQFESFINEVEEIFDQFQSAYSLENEKIDFNLSMMLFHTLNGGFGIYNILSLQQLARDYETELTNIKDSDPDPIEYIPFLQSHIANLKEEFFNFRVELDKILGTKFSLNQVIFEIPRSKVLNLKPLILSTNNQQLIDLYRNEFLNLEIKNYFKAYDDLCKSVAVKIGKNFEGIRFENEQLKIEPEPYLEFFNVLVHLFRNCLDHGLEDSYTRESKGKSPVGHIDVSFNEINNGEQKYLSLKISDDGNGINPEIIRNKYSQVRPDEDVSHLTDEEIIYKIFDPFFSTRDEVSALSGRGVGMSAIKEVVDRMHGTIKIISIVGEGSQFFFEIPINS